MIPHGVPQRLQQAYLFARDAAIGEKVTLAGYGPRDRERRPHPAERASTFTWTDVNGILNFVDHSAKLKGGTSVLMGRTYGDLFRTIQQEDVKDSQWLCLKFYGAPEIIRGKLKPYPDPAVRVGFTGGAFVAWRLSEPVIAETLFSLGSQLADKLGAISTNFIPLPGVPLPDGDIPRLHLFTKGTGVPVEKFGGHSESGATEGEVLQTADQLKIPPMSWLWPGFAPEGNLCLIMGEPGVGKSQLAMDIASRITRGTEWPDGAAGIRPGGVAFFETEDSLGDTLARADAAGADRSRLVASSDCLDLSTDAGIAELERKISALRDIRALILSPFGMFFGEIKSYKDTDIRRLMVPLLAWAAKKKVSIIGVMHKGAGSKGRSAEDAAGPQAFGRRARVMLAAIVDQNDPAFKQNPKKARRLLVGAKANNGRDDMELPYRIVSAGEASKIHWLEREQTEAGQDLDTAEVSILPTRRQRPDEWLRERLLQGEAPAADIEKEAREAGIPRATLYRIKDKAGVESERGKFGGTAVWRLVK
jgi:putative DNA primase/helicase